MCDSHQPLNGADSEPRLTREPDLMGIPCVICGSKTSAAERLYGGEVYCIANADGRDRCREREMAKVAQ